MFKQKVMMILRKVPKVLGIILLVSAVLFVGFQLFLSMYFKPHDVRLTNVTDTSFTVSWITNYPMRGIVYYKEKDSILPGILSWIGTKRAYDDRDIALAEQECVEKFNKEAKVSEDFVVDTSKYGCNQVKVKKTGKYFTHHVTLTDLEPNKEYYFRIGDGIFSYKGDINKSAIFLPLRGEVKAPAPIFGKIVNDKGEYVNDSVVYIKFINGYLGKESMYYSSVTARDGSWYLDSNNIRTIEGEPIVVEDKQDMIKVYAQYQNYTLGDANDWVYGNGDFAYPDIVVSDTWQKDLSMSPTPYNDHYMEWIRRTFASDTTDEDITSGIEKLKAYLAMENTAPNTQPTLITESVKRDGVSNSFTKIFLENTYVWEYVLFGVFVLLFVVLLAFWLKNRNTAIFFRLRKGYGVLQVLLLAVPVIYLGIKVNTVQNLSSEDSYACDAFTGAGCKSWAEREAARQESDDFRQQNPKQWDKANDYINSNGGRDAAVAAGNEAALKQSQAAMQNDGKKNEDGTYSNREQSKKDGKMTSDCLSNISNCSAQQLANNASILGYGKVRDVLQTRINNYNDSSLITVNSKPVEINGKVVNNETDILVAMGLCNTAVACAGNISSLTGKNISASDLIGEGKLFSSNTKMNERVQYSFDSKGNIKFAPVNPEIPKAITFNANCYETGGMGGQPIYYLCKDPNTNQTFRPDSNIQKKLETNCKDSSNNCSQEFTKRGDGRFVLRSANSPTDVMPPEIGPTAHHEAGTCTLTAGNIYRCVNAENKVIVMTSNLRDSIKEQCKSSEVCYFTCENNSCFTSPEMIYSFPTASQYTPVVKKGGSPHIELTGVDGKSKKYIRVNISVDERCKNWDKGNICLFKSEYISIANVDHLLTLRIIGSPIKDQIRNSLNTATIQAMPKGVLSLGNGIDLKFDEKTYGFRLESYAFTGNIIDNKIKKIKVSDDLVKIFPGLYGYLNKEIELGLLQTFIDAANKSRYGIEPRTGITSQNGDGTTDSQTDVTLTFTKKVRCHKQENNEFACKVDDTYLDDIPYSLKEQLENNAYCNTINSNDCILYCSTVECSGVSRYYESAKDQQTNISVYYDSKEGKYMYMSDGFQPTSFELNRDDDFIIQLSTQCGKDLSTIVEGDACSVVVNKSDIDGRLGITDSVLGTTDITSSNNGSTNNTNTLGSGYITYLPEYGFFDMEIEGLKETEKVEGNTLRIFYVETNGVEGFQPPADPDNPKKTEDIMLQSNSLNISYKKSAEVMTLNLKRGVNLVSFNYIPKIENNEYSKASSLLKWLLSKGVRVEHISYFSGGRWKGIGYVDGKTTGDDFNITPGKGYLIYTEADAKVNIPGYKITSSVPVPLGAGWNLIGVHGYNEMYTARSLIDSINSIDGLTANNVSWWPTSKGKYEGLQVVDGKQYGFDFSLSSSNGYFVRISKFKPKDSKCKSLLWHAGGSHNGACGGSK